MIHGINWRTYHLLVTVSRGREFYTFLLDRATQEELVDRMFQQYGRVFGIVGVQTITEEVFDRLRPGFSAVHVIEGE